MPRSTKHHGAVRRGKEPRAGTLTHFYPLLSDVQSTGLITHHVRILFVLDAYRLKAHKSHHRDGIPALRHVDTHTLQQVVERQTHRPGQHHTRYLA